jgi:hypothetical protein
VTIRALLPVVGLLLLVPPSHFDVSAAFKPKGKSAGEVVVTFLPKDPDVHINTTPAPRLKLEPGQALQDVPPAPVPKAPEGEARYLDTSSPVVFPVTVAPAPPPAGPVKGTLTYFYCSKREGWCRKGTADLEFPVSLK